MACLRRYAATPADEVAHAARPGIVGGGGEAEIAELAAQLGQESRRLGDGRPWIEGIEQSALIGGVRHELRDPLRPMTAARRRPDGVRLKSAFLPNQPGEEFKRQSVRRRCRFEDQAHRVGQAADFGCRDIARLRLRPCPTRLFFALRLISILGGWRRGLLDSSFLRSGILIVLGAIGGRGGWRTGFVDNRFSGSRRSI